MTIKRFNNAFGTTTDSPLGSTATTMNSAELPRLGAIATSGEFARVTLDPGRENGDPEIIHVTDYDGTATSATIERGKEGTSQREHASGTTWEHAPTVEDVNAGDASGTDAVAVHSSATAAGDESVVVGTSATDNGNIGSVVVGGNAFSSGARSVVIGLQSEAGGSTSVVIGRWATGSGNGNAVVGYNAQAGNESVAIGKDADATTGLTPDGVAVGQAASAGRRGVAIGKDSSCDTDAVALGEGVSTSATDQVHVGGRHLALDEIADPATPPADEVRLYARDDGAGTSELVVVFPSGNSTVLATGTA